MRWNGSNAGMHMSDSVVVKEIAIAEVGRSAAKARLKSANEYPATPVVCLVANYITSLEGGRSLLFNAGGPAIVGSLVVEQLAVRKVGRSVDENSTTLHAKDCNQSRDVPVGFEFGTLTEPSL